MRETDLLLLLEKGGGKSDCQNEGRGENKMRYASVCSGVEAASLAWMPLGWEAVWFSEIEPFPCAVLKERFPDVPNLGDMTKIEGEKYRGKIDLLVGGTPCQDLSIAGKRAGFGGKRSSLALDFVRLAYESGCKWIVWENVPGVFSSRGGGDFAAFLSLLSGSKVEIPDRGFAASGFVCNARRDRYGLAWRVLDAQFTRVSGFSFAVPQRRRRVFVVGYFGDWTRAAEVLLEPDRVQWNTPPRRIKGTGVARSLTASTGGASGKEQQNTFISGDGRLLNELGVDGYNGAISGQVSATVDINCKNVNGPTLVMANGQANAEVSEAFSPALTCDHESPIVCAHETGQGYWQDGDIAGTLRAEGENRPSRPSNIICAGFSGGQGAKAGGIGYQDGVAPTIRASESGSNQIPDILCQYGDIAGALTARHDSSPCVDRGMNILCYENHAQDSRIKPCGECSPQINAKAGTGGCNLPLVQAVAVAENIIGRKENNGGNGTGAQVELAYTQNATGVMGACNTTQGENQNADAEKARAVKILRLLRDEIGEKAFCEWTLGRLGSFQAEKVLQPNLHGESVRREAGEEKTRLDDSALSCAKNNAKNDLRCLWEQFQLGHPSQGQELAQQFTAELNLRLSQLPHEIASVATVRRLLPIETERLMGFPDNWTRIPWRGKPEEECPDSPRYKACGNSMCVNVMRWIGMRIEFVERRMK